MTSFHQARAAYFPTQAPTRTPRDAEYALFARATRALKMVDETDKSQFPELARAVRTNQRLWGALADDLLHEGNALPIQLRAQLISLAEFVRKHSLAILAGKGSAAPLVDINTAIMKGLRGEVGA